MSELRRRIAALPPEKRALLASKNPLSFAQRRFWFLDRLDPGSAAFNVAAALRLAGPLDPLLLLRALEALTERHAALRTTFPSFEGRPFQLVERNAPAPVALPRVDLSALPAVAQAAEVRAVVRVEAAVPFDLAAGPLMRTVLLVLGPADHGLVLDLHHIVCDGWSQEILVRELGEVYTALVERRPPRLPVLPIQYTDYARWQIEWLAGDGSRRQLDYWRLRLLGIPPVNDLPADRPRLGGTGTAGRRPLGRHAGHPLPAGLAAGLESLGRAAGASLFMVVLAAFQALLYRLSGNPDAVVGTPLAARPRTETEGVVGLFQNLLVIRTDLSGRPPFAELLDRVRHGTLAAYEHADVPFDLLVDELQPERTPGVHPLFQVLFTQVSRRPAQAEGAGLRIEHLGGAGDSGEYDLALFVHGWGERIALSAEYNAALFDRPTVQRLLASFAVLLQAVAAGDEAAGLAVEALPLFGEAERWQMLGEWNDTAVRREPALVHRLVEEQAAKRPEAVAVFCEGETLAFGELDRRANRLAHRLRRLGIQAEDRVGVALERSFDQVAAVLAVLKAGGAYVPLDPGLPAERRAFLVQDAALAAVVGREDVDAIESEPDAPLDLAVDPANLVYVLYTSGSTGRPKGAMNTHGALANELLLSRDAYALGPSDRGLLHTALGFDVSFWEMFLPLSAGASLVLAKPGGPPDPGDLVERIARGGVTFFSTVPSLLRYFLDAPGIGRCLPGLRAVVSGGEALPPDLARRFHERLPGVLLWNAYGPTEAAVDVCVGLDPLENGSGPVPIGRPVANVRAYVLDGEMRPVPLGAAGELYAGGAGLARGYWGRPGLTAERFVPDACSGEPGGRLYRTGDLARLRHGGEIEIRGRLDDQVKIRGVRIEPAEIEAVLAEHPGTGRALVLMRSSPAGEDRLVAYLTPAAESGLAALQESHERGELIRFAESRLPAAMVPSAFAVLADLPLLDNGKVDRRALPEPPAGRLGSGRRYAPPRDGLELALVRLWEEVLETGPIGRGDGFFDLGGHSLLAVLLLARIRTHLGRDLPLASLFAGPTVAHQAALLRSAPDGQPPPQRALVALRAEGEGPPFFCVHPVGGNVLCYFELARLLGTPFYGLQATSPGTGGIPEMAARYLDEIREIQPAGPYRLGGWSMGALVAFEMACRLEREGAEVSLLALIDPPMPSKELSGSEFRSESRPSPRGGGGLEPGGGQEGGRFDLAESGVFVEQAAPLLASPLSQPPPSQGGGTPGSTFREIPTPFPEPLDEAALRAGLRRDLEGLYGEADLDPAAWLPLFELFRANESALRAYRPEPAFSGRADLFLAAGRETDGEEWRPFLPGGVEVHRLTGDHYGILKEPHVCLLAERLAGAR